MFPFWELNFAYQWSNLLASYNTAVLGMNKKNVHSLVKFYELVINPTEDLKTLIDALHPHSFSLAIGAFQPELILKKFHSFLFDPAWLCFDEALPRFDKKTICSFDEINHEKFIDETEFKLEEFFKGAFTYHLHTVDCGQGVRSGSYFDYLERHFYKLLASRLKSV